MASAPQVAGGGSLLNRHCLGHGTPEVSFLKTLRKCKEVPRLSELSRGDRVCYQNVHLEAPPHQHPAAQQRALSGMVRAPRPGVADVSGGGVSTAWELAGTVC